MKPAAPDLQSHHHAPHGPAALHRDRHHPRRAATTALTSVVALSALAGLGGCALPSAAPRLDAELGRATRQALAQQVLRPDAGSQASPPAGLDGVSAVHALTRHREGFKTPPASFGVLGIGSASNP